MKKDPTATKRQAEYLARLHNTGIKRVTVQVPFRDEDKIRELASHLVSAFLAERPET